MRPPRIGDVIEIPTASGLAYAQFTHKVPLYGHLIRVVEGMWRTRPQALEEVVNAPTRFFTFFPVASTLRSDGLRVLVRPGATGGWLALARSEPAPTENAFADLEARLRKLAESLSGEYDGWEAAVSA